MWWRLLAQCLKEAHVVLGVLEPIVGMQRVKETGWAKVRTTGKGCPTALKVLSSPCQRKTHFQNRISYSVWSLLAIWWPWSIPRLLVLLYLRWNSSSLCCLNICVSNFLYTKIYLWGSGLQSGISPHKNQQVSKFLHPHHSIFRFAQGRKVIRAKGTTWHRYY